MFQKSSNTLILVGTKCDLRDGIQDKISNTAALAFAEKHGAAEYHECSALTQEGISTIFDRAAILGVKCLQGKN
jgi:hypothetical protein